MPKYIDKDTEKYYTIEIFIFPVDTKGINDEMKDCGDEVRIPIGNNGEFFIGEGIANIGEVHEPVCFKGGGSGSDDCMNWMKVNYPNYKYAEIGKDGKVSYGHVSRITDEDKLSAIQKLAEDKFGLSKLIETKIEDEINFFCTVPLEPKNYDQIIKELNK